MVSVFTAHVSEETVTVTSTTLQVIRFGVLPPLYPLGVCSHLRATVGWSRPSCSQVPPGVGGSGGPRHCGQWGRGRRGELCGHGGATLLGADHPCVPLGSALPWLHSGALFRVPSLSIPSSLSVCSEGCLSPPTQLPPPLLSSVLGPVRWKSFMGTCLSEKRFSVGASPQARAFEVDFGVLADLGSVHPPYPLSAAPRGRVCEPVQQALVSSCLQYRW